MKVMLNFFVDEQNESSLESEVNVIKNVGIGKNETKMVEFNGGTIGFLKNSSGTTTAILDDLEYFISTLGKHVLNINVADIYKAFNGSEFVGTISKNVAGENESLIMLSEIIDLLLEDQKSEVVALANKIDDIRTRTTQKFPKPNGTIVERPVLTDDSDICQIIDMFPMALDLINVPKDQKEIIKKEYFKMIVFDLLTNQVDRNNNNYGIVHNKVSGLTRFSELFDNSTIYIPGLPKSHYNLNGFLIDRKLLIGCLLENYGEYVDDIILPLTENKDSIIQKTQHLAQKTLTTSEQEMFMPLFSKNMDVICEAAKEKHTSSRK